MRFPQRVVLKSQGRGSCVTRGQGRRAQLLSDPSTRPHRPDAPWPQAAAARRLRPSPAGVQGAAARLRFPQFAAGSSPPSDTKSKGGPTGGREGMRWCLDGTLSKRNNGRRAELSPSLASPSPALAPWPLAPAAAPPPAGAGARARSPRGWRHCCWPRTRRACSAGGPRCPPRGAPHPPSPSPAAPAPPPCRPPGLRRQGEGGRAKGGKDEGKENEQGRMQCMPRPCAVVPSALTVRCSCFSRWSASYSSSKARRPSPACCSNCIRRPG